LLSTLCTPEIDQLLVVAAFLAVYDGTLPVRVT
jgi:hypothetical protein